MKYIKKMLAVSALFILFNTVAVKGMFLSYKNINFNNISEENALENLRISKSYHILKKFNSAIEGYHSILKSSAPQYIKNEALIYTMLAEEKKPISMKYVYHPNFVEAVSKAQKDYKDKEFANILKLNHYYSPLGSYFSYAENNYRECDELTFDSHNIPMLKYGDQFYYNPITISQYALSMYGKYLEGADTKKNFLASADFLINYMDERGALRYNFPYHHYEDFAPGWTSSMAQGQALSVWARAFALTNNPKYIKAGNTALKYLLTPVTQGGVMDTLKTLDVNLQDKVFFQEYVNTVSSYTLNGYIFTLIGLYDWSQIKKDVNEYYSAIANQYFDKGIESLKCILPYYDLGGFTSYDLCYITKNTEPNSSGVYHAIHIEQLDKIYYITKDIYFKHMRDLWGSYVI